MDAPQTVRALSALAHEARLAIYKPPVAAGQEGLPAGDIAGMLAIAPSALTFHKRFFMSSKVFNVLFLCTGNSARSILAESLLNALGKGRFKAFSAGSYPTGKVNPFAIAFLAKSGLPADDFRSKSWDEFAAPGAPVMDYVLTVCDQAAGEQCPVWPGQPMSAHWGVADPAAVEGSDDEKRRAFKDVATTLQKRIELFTSLPTATLDRMSLNAKLDTIGKVV